MANAKMYEVINKKIRFRLEEAIISGEKFKWVKGWSGIPTGNAIRYLEKEGFSPYRGINALLLDGLYITYNQLENFQKKHPEERFVIPKGIKRETVYFYKLIDIKEVVDGEEVVKKIPLMKYHNVFSINDIQNLSVFFCNERTEHILSDDMLKADKVLEAYCKREDINFSIQNGTDKCCYYPKAHLISVPDKSQFKSVYEAYSSYFHEAIHSTGKTLHRELNGSFGDDKYSFEELVAEIGSEMCCAYLGIADEDVFENSIAYIKGWLSKLGKSDMNFIVRASSQAQKASDLILNINQN